MVGGTGLENLQTSSPLSMHPGYMSHPYHTPFRNLTHDEYSMQWVFAIYRNNVIRYLAYLTGRQDTMDTYAIESLRRLEKV